MSAQAARPNLLRTDTPKQVAPPPQRAEETLAYVLCIVDDSPSSRPPIPMVGKRTAFETPGRLLETWLPRRSG